MPWGLRRNKDPSPLSASCNPLAIRIKLILAAASGCGWAIMMIGLGVNDAAEFLHVSSATIRKRGRPHSSRHQRQVLEIIEHRKWRFLCGRLCASLSRIRLSTGAGEGIRTLDPNLGKVVLYP